MSLLPYNATKFEKVVEQAIKYNIDAIFLAGFKFKTTGENMNMALSWEYSLSQINVDDFKDRVIQGLQFHRLRGTPYALRLAFAWYGFANIYSFQFANAYCIKSNNESNFCFDDAIFNLRWRQKCSIGFRSGE